MSVSVMFLSAFAHVPYYENKLDLTDYTSVIACVGYAISNGYR